MNHSIIKLVLLLFLSISSSFIYAQIEKGELIKGSKLSAEIAPNEKHHYSVDLEKDQFSFFRLMQKGVDVKITTYDASGEMLEDFDSPNGKNGYELFTITSVQKGKYIIEVSPFDEEEPIGNYEIAVEIIKPKATSEAGQVDELFSPWTSKDTPGASVAVVRDGEILYKKGYGMSNLEYDIPIDPNTVFHIASVSKQFTVFAVLLLEKEGKLSLDDDIRKYIPEVPDFGKTITLRHLASHTSGLRDQWNLLAMAGWRLDDVITKEHVLKLVSKQKELNFEPGEEYTYCNTGFTLLAEVVSRVSDMTFAEFTEENIFEPLEMNSTLFYDDHEKVVKNRAYSYYSSSTGFKKSVLNYANVGATSLFTTVEDLSLWAMNFSDIKVGDASIIETMNMPATLNNGETFGGALGQFVGEYKGLNEIQHGGGDAGFRTYLTRFPEENFSVVVFSNAAEFSSGGMAHKVVDIYLKDKIKVEEKAEEKEETASDKLVLDEALMETYLGDFELQPGFLITLIEEDGNLIAQATGQGSVALIPLSNTEFKVQGVEAKIEIIPNEGAQIEMIKLHQGGQIMDAPRAEIFDTDAVNLVDFSGEFYSEELATTYSFVVEEGELIAKHIRHSDFKILPVKQDVFNGQAWFFGQVEFVRNENQEIVGCKVTNGRVRNLYFEKVK